MGNVNLNVLYSKLLEVQKEVREVKAALIPETKISASEHKELDAILKDMKGGNERNWREAFRG